MSILYGFCAHGIAPARERAPVFSQAEIWQKRGGFDPAPTAMKHDYFCQHKKDDF